jgi:endogenous inhibitor of DNA gyrase (YacG/DUF329 family)
MSEDEVEIIHPPDEVLGNHQLGRECPICLDPVTSGGLHRIVVTKCGHTFGKSCIFRSLEVKNECPSCRKRVRKRDLIDLYDVEVIAVESSALDKLQQQLQEEKSHRAKVDNRCWFCLISLPAPLPD